MNISEAIINTYGKDQLQVLKSLPYDDAKKTIGLLLKRDMPKYHLSWGAKAHITNAVLKKI